METIKLNPKETGWVFIDSDVKMIVAHFNNGHKETMSPLDLVAISAIDKRKINKIVQIDCYKEGEEIK